MSFLIFLTLLAGYFAWKKADDKPFQAIIWGAVALLGFLGAVGLGTMDNDKSASNSDPQKDARVELRVLVTSFARDPKSLEFDYNSWKYYSNGVCVRANGKNAFGGYTGFKEYCLLKDAKTGNKTLTIDGVAQ
jgi:hypothetical protein